VEVLRRMEEDIYDREEYERALAWRKEYCREGLDKNPEQARKSPQQKESDWEFAVKSACIIKDLLNGNERLKGRFPEEAIGHNAIAGGFQGQRQWTDHYPNTDFTEAVLASSFDWNGAREPYIFATENDTLNAASMLFGKLLTGCAQMFSDVRTYWSKEAVRRAAGYELSGMAKEAGGFIHLINSGASCLDMCGEVRDAGGRAVIL
jgi:L-fucose isomerase